MGLEGILKFQLFLVLTTQSESDSLKWATVNAQNNKNAMC